MNKPENNSEFLRDFLPQVKILKDVLKKNKKVLLTTHERPDGDAVGSVLGLGFALRQLDIEVTFYTPDAPPEYLAFLSGFEEITQNIGSLKSYDAVFALDHSELKRTRLHREIEASKKFLISIDHHATSDRKGDIVIVVPSAAANCEIIAELLPLLGAKIDDKIATALLTGIVTDTGSFQHANVTTHALALASKLMGYGANLRAVTRAVYGKRSLASLRIIGRALERVQANKKTGAAFSVITHQDLKECGATLEDLSGVVNMLNSIPEASFSFLLTEYEEGKLKGSLRSEPEKAVDVSEIAKKFGGGGHKLASGFEVAGTLVKEEDGWKII